jgi:hypothetical protein
MELEDNACKLKAKLEEKQRAMIKKSDILKLDLEQLDQKANQLSATFVEASDIIQHRNEAKGQLEKSQIDRCTSFSMKMSLQSEIESIHKILEHDRRSIHDEKLVAAKLSESKNDTDGLDFDSKKAELDVLIAKDKEQDDFLKCTDFPGKECLVKTIEDKKKELEEIKEGISRVTSDFEAKESTVQELKRLLHDQREEYETAFKKTETQIAEENETFLALERQMKESIHTAQRNELGMVLRKVKVYKYAIQLLKKSRGKEATLATMSKQ